MSQTGSRGQGGPPKLPPAAAGKAGTPAPPQVAKPAAAPAKPQAPRAPMQTKPGITATAPHGAPRPVSAPAWTEGQRDGTSAALPGRDPHQEDELTTADGLRRAQKEGPGEAPFDEDETVVGVRPGAAKVAAGVAPAALGSFSRDEIRVVVRAAIDEAMAPVQHMLKDVEQRMGDLERRLTDLERRPIQVEAVASPAAHAPARAPSTPGPYAAAVALPPADVAARPAALAPRIDLKAIEQNVKLDPSELALLDGSRRKRRNVMLLVLFLLLLFGGMGYALARSYMPQ
jgi:hypothetical protein